MTSIYWDSVIRTPRTGTVVVPAFNEGQTVARTVHTIATVLATSLPDLGWEIVVVDDGSADDTGAQARATATELMVGGPVVRVLRHTANRGLGAALQTGFAASTGDVVVVVDCDLSYHADHIPALVRALVDGNAQVAIASPYMAGGHTIGVPRTIEFRSRLANAFLSRAANSALRTLTGMVRAYDGPFVRELALNSSSDVINVEALYKTQVLRGRIVEVPATLDWRGLERRVGRTGLVSRRTRAKTVQMFVSGLLFRPYLVFVILGLSLIGVGSLLGLVAVVLPGMQLGLTILGVSLMGAGITASIATMLSVQVNRCFEELYHLQSRARPLIRQCGPDPTGAAEVVAAAGVSFPAEAGSRRTIAAAAPPSTPPLHMARAERVEPSAGTA